MLQRLFLYTYYMQIDDTLLDKTGYLERMSKSLQEKLKVISYIPEGAKDALDVGCADGSITEAMANLLPNITFLGIDLSHDFVGQASAKTSHAQNLSFKRQYLRESLAEEKRYDVIFFTSVLHEFFSYGEGISSVLKALADAHELLNPGGVIIIRDMVLPEYTKHTHTIADTIEKKVTSKEDLKQYIADFEAAHGKLDSLYSINHFLLKYFYTDNWVRECAEHYVPVTLEQYETLFNLLGMEIIQRDTYTIPYLKDKWTADFNLTPTEVDALHSTTIFVAKKGFSKGII
jgi:2-polyprenyl-3-methyl-5-hydroxy-6-metoxy-1,4-benzoquinol methylase